MDPITRQGITVAAGAGGAITGDSSSNPAVSGIEIRDQGQSTGWYWIQTSNMSSAELIYVNNTDDGGGWMLVCYESRSADNGNGFQYPNAFNWTSSTPPSNWNGRRITANAYKLWYHNGNAQCNRAMRMASTSADHQPILSNCSIGRRVVYDSPNSFRPMVTSTINTTTKLSGTWTPLKGYTSMNTSLSIDAPCDWMYAANDWWTDCGPSNDITTTGRSGNGQGTGSWTNPTTNNIYGLKDVSVNGTGNRSDINTFAQYIR